MYLPTDLKTIYNVMIDSERRSRQFWFKEEAHCADNDVKGRAVCRNAAAEAHGRMWALYDLRDGSYIV